MGWFVYDIQVAFSGQSFSLLQRVGAIVVSSCLAWINVDVKAEIHVWRVLN